MMTVSVQEGSAGPVLVGDWDGVQDANAFLEHLRARAFAAATVRAYAFDLVNFGRFLLERRLGLGEVAPVDVFGWVSWQGVATSGASPATLRPSARRAAPATVNRRVAAVRSFFEFLLISQKVTVNPVPAPRRGQGLRPSARGLLGHLGPGRARGGGRLVREPRRLPESLEVADVQAFLASLGTHLDRAMVLAMLLGGLRSGEVRGLLLRDVDQGRRRIRVLGKGDANVSSRSSVPSSPSWPPTCATSDHLGSRPRSASSCCAARAPARRCPRQGCGHCSAGTGNRAARRGCVRTGCGTPTAPS